VNVVDGSINFLECYTTNAEADAALYSKDDLKIKGGGSLYVFCDNEHGVACNNDLEIEECELMVDAEKTGISSHKSILISSGVITTNGDNCGIRSWDHIEINGGMVTACGGKKSEADRGGIISDTGHFYINGGTVMAVGMNQTIPIGQTSAIFSFPTVITKDNLVSVSIDGMSLATATPNKKYSSVLISDPALYIGGTLDIWLNDAHYDNMTLTDPVTQAILDGLV
ncbi:MAG: carbohydrate-binding domain-containing protein, partial [Oscillospiraceae bacterium]|nr:carbohydrate-binding domain-containing protein [Oscillospiraceae bacterium]